MNLTRLAIKRPVTTSMFFLSIILFGLVASRLLPLELFPGIDIPRVFIQVPYKGSSPAEVEREITQVLEESLATMSGITDMKSDSSQNGANIQLSMKWGENVANKALEAREKVDAVRHLLPTDVERVFIRQFSTSDMPILTIRIASEGDLSNAFDLLDKQLRKPLERLDGVSQVTLYGVEQKQIEIRVDALGLTRAGISAGALQSRLAAENFVINGGSLRQQGRVFQVSPKGEFTSISAIENIALTDKLLLKDIASVRYALPEQIEGRHLDRRFAVGVDVFKDSGSNLVAVSERVINVIEQVKQDPQFAGVRLYIMEDQADGVKSSLQDLLMAGGIGALLSFGVLYLFLRDFRLTLVVVISVPVSISMTLAAMYVLGYSLNILSMMGLLLAIGMLIDNAVVVSESVLQEQEHDPSNRQAVFDGVDKVSLAILAGTLTTAIVFLPNIFGVKVQLTIFLEHVAIAICISLLVSLLVAKTLLPLLLTTLKFAPKAIQTTPKLTHQYQRSLSWLLAHPKIGAVVAVLLLASTALPLSLVQQDQSDGESNGRLYINYQVEGRHNLHVTQAMIDKMEAYLYQHQEAFFIESVYSYYSADDGQSTLILKPDIPIPMAELKEQIRQGFPHFAIATPQFGWGNDQNGLRITLTGRSTTELIRLSEQLLPLIRNIDGLSDVRSEVNGSQQEVLIQLSNEMASRLNIPVSQLASLVATALRGSQLRSYRHDPNGEIRIELAYDKQWQQSLDALRSLPLVRQQNRTFSLGDVADIAIVPRFDTIRHYDRKTALSIGANLNDITMEDAGEQLTALLDNVPFPDGYGYSLRGGFERQNEEQGIMVVNMILAIAMIYIVMAALFESLLLPSAIITSILFSITGVFWALLLTGTPMSVMAMIGILILMGVVVNNGIVLVDQINQQRPELEALSQAITTICMTRLRPVLMTVSTTVLGLVPLALEDTQIGGGGPPYAPMAIAIIGGLLFSTVTSLYLVPLCYQALFRLRHRSAIALGQSQKWAVKATPWIKQS
ncbi:efflux RND transporter permease subunit [Shewanella sp. NIFS-20-20]|uniref:efflux RND transporter permease subunit n=1 Tax=Shewanella sp. NIFS-20-20 TaxID=2853806 RepID=UPI001C4888A2|nr:efflux RND transporter permease subunit [Shewanella sp. NIFS-20-20]MBV7315511.1 efflux RND transporter permease subunit [Shewanella sp. NIFS-20-20]